GAPRHWAPPRAAGHGQDGWLGRLEGNPYLAWAYVEAAQFAIRFNPRVQRFYQRKQAKSPLMVARKAVAHTLARACYDLRRALGPFEVHKACGCGRATGGVAGGGGGEKWLKTIQFV